jgi:hypothetical protein
MVARSSSSAGECCILAFLACGTAHSTGMSAFAKLGRLHTARLHTARLHTAILHTVVLYTVRLHTVRCTFRLSGALAIQMQGGATCSYSRLASTIILSFTLGFKQANKQGTSK